MEFERKDPQSTTPRSWRTASQLARRFVGSQPSIARRMIEVRRALIGDIEAAGKPADEAEALVDELLIRQQDGSSGRPNPAASQDGISHLALTDRSQVEPLPPDGWISVAQFSRQHGISREKAVEMAVRLYRESVAAFQQAGSAEKDAVAHVQASFIRCSRATEGRRRVWHLSQAAVEQLLTTGITLRSPGTQPAPAAWQMQWTLLLRSLIADMNRCGYSQSEAVEAIQSYLADASRSAENSVGSQR